MRLFLLVFFCALAGNNFAQAVPSRADSLRGRVTPLRTCYDVVHYDLSVNIDIPDRRLTGKNAMTYRVVEDFQTLQVDLDSMMQMDSIVFEGRLLKFERDAGAVFVQFPAIQHKGTAGRLTMYYSGRPREANVPPWDGGFSWEKDFKKRDWVAVSCEGIGASIWWPNKDFLADEPDSMDMRFVVPAGLQAISNGVLVSVKKLPFGKKQFHWKVHYPINNYNVTVYVGAYAHLHDTYVAEGGDSLDLDYYVLDGHEEKARAHFNKEVPLMLRIFESYFGKYPFWKDGYALVEAPYLGMEHQSAIGYGNRFMSGYLGGRLPQGMDWDYIIVHESGHEYWGNSVSCGDLAEMWIHEGFTTYMEALYVEKRYGYEKALDYLETQKGRIQNREPIIGPLGVNYSSMFSTDKYYKGSWFLHTLRHAIGDDKVWFGLLRGFYDKYAYSIATVQDFIDYVNQYTGHDYTAVIRQYLYHARPPVLVYKLRRCGKNLIVRYKWEAAEPGFDMEVLLGDASRPLRVRPVTGRWKKLKIKRLKKEDFTVDTRRFYLGTQEE